MRSIYLRYTFPSYTFSIPLQINASITYADMVIYDYQTLINKSMR